MSKEFIKPVIIAAYIATPVAWYAMNEWLKDFAYHIQINWMVFAVVTILVLALTILMMSVQSIIAPPSKEFENGMMNVNGESSIVNENHTS